MRIKLDENLPIAAAGVAVQLGHDVDTVNGERLTGASDSDVVAAATTDGRLLITLDRRLADLRAYPPGSHAGIAVLRVDSQDAGSVTDAMRSFLSSEELDDLSGCIVVVRGHLARVRRPR